MFDFGLARKAASRLRFASIFKRAISFATSAIFSGDAVERIQQHQPNAPPSTDHTSRNTQHRRSFSPCDGSAGNIANSITLTNLRERYRGFSEVRIRVERRNAQRKERSSQRALRAEHARSRSLEPSPSTPTSLGTPEICVLTLEVRGPQGSEGSKSEDDLTSLDDVAATRVLDPAPARAGSDFKFIDPIDFTVQLEKERRRLESAMELRGRGKGKEREQEQEVREKERRQEMEMEEIRLINQARIQEIKERNAVEARLRAERRARLAEEEAARQRRALVESTHPLLNQERQLSVNVEETVEHNHITALQEEEARRQAERAQLEEELQAWLLEFEANTNLPAVNIMNNPLLTFDAGPTVPPDEVNQMFPVQEDPFHAQMETYWPAQEQLHAQSWEEQQAFGLPQDIGSQDVQMGNPQFFNFHDVDPSLWQ